MSKSRVVFALGGLISVVAAVAIIQLQRTPIPQDADSNVPTSGNSPVVAQITKRQGVVTPPDYIDQTTLEIVSLGDVSSVADDGSIEVPVYEEGTTAVIAMLPDRDFGLMDIVVEDKEPELTLFNTAVAMVFSSPYLMSPDPILATRIIEVIEAEPATSALLDELDRVLQSDVDPFTDEDFTDAYRVAIENSLTTLTEQSAEQ